MSSHFVSNARAKLVFVSTLLCGATFLAHADDIGRVSGVVVGSQSHAPVAFATIVLSNKESAAAVQSAITDKSGAFTLEKIPPGDYVLSYALPGAETRETRSIHLDAEHAALELGTLNLADESVKMNVMVVSADKSTFYNSIDRKVYDVGQNVLSATGSASDVLQNIPSVSVDLDGVVSLRGSDSVTILIDGRSSSLMGANRAAVLEQMPADSIERIEVITNPSAKYKPDGTAGIINLVMKKRHDPGFSGSFGVNVGMDERINSNLTSSFERGPYSIFGSYSIRQDDRVRTSIDALTSVDPVSGAKTTTLETTREHARPLSHIVRAGLDVRPDAQNKFGLSSSFNHRSFLRRELAHTLTAENGAGSAADFDRSRVDPEFERDFEASTNYQHAFAGDGHELNIDFKYSNGAEQEDNHYTNIFRLPVAETSFDNTLIRNESTGTELVAEYVRPLAGGAKFESGYTREGDRNDANFFGEFFDPVAARWVKDDAKSNRFVLNQTVHAFYATYGRPLGRFGFLGGVRLEQAFITSHLVNTGETIPNDYFRLYPSLHLSYKLAEGHELQLNYSHRVRRPEGDDLNPFPEFRDLHNLRAGNPHLLPEDIHSYEFGYQFKKDETSLVATAYYRDLHHGFTEVTRLIDDATLLTTKTNLATSRSLGIELAADAAVTKWAALNFSSNTFFNTIDASNLGFSDRRSTVSWIAKLGTSLHVAKNTLVQINANYTSDRLTAQGERGSSYVVNLGVRREIFQKRAALVFTVSDLFDSSRERTILETPALHEEITRRRNPRIIYLGFLYKFGHQPQKAKDEPLKLDEGL